MTGNSGQPSCKYVRGGCTDDWCPLPHVVASTLRRALKTALFATKPCVFNAPPLRALRCPPWSLSGILFTTDPAAPTAGLSFQVIGAPPLIAAKLVIADTARGHRSRTPQRSCNALRLHIDLVGAMSVKQHWPAGWLIRCQRSALPRPARGRGRVAAAVRLGAASPLRRAARRQRCCRK